MSSDAARIADLEARLRLAEHDKDLARIEAAVTRVKNREYRARGAHMAATQLQLKGKILRYTWENEYLRDKLKATENARRDANLKLKDAETPKVHPPWYIDPLQKTQRRSTRLSAGSEERLQVVRDNSEVTEESSKKKRRITKDSQEIMNDVKMRLVNFHMQDLSIQEKIDEPKVEPRREFRRTLP